MSLALSTLAALAALLPATLAQTHTDCNPLNSTGCPNMPALGGNVTFHFNDTLYDNIWTKKNQGKVDWSEKGATFTIERSGDSGQLVSNFYMMFGRISVVMKSATGEGIVSSAILQSECLDEIDWEFLGSKPKQISTNYFGKGNRTTAEPSRGQDFEKGPPADDFHNYTIDWTKDRIQWWFDNEQLREVKFADALGGKNYPQTPMNIRIGAWAGGDKSNNDKGVVEWAGGVTDFSKGPFVMSVQQIYAQDYTTAKEYSWENMDASGSFEKVKVIEGKSETLEEYAKPHGARNRWNALSKGARIAIVASILGFVVIVAAVILFCCIKQRRAGRREFAAVRAQQDKEAAELLTYRGHTTNMGYNRI